MNDTKATVLDLQARYQEQAAAPFTFTWADREWTLPAMRSLDYRIQGEIEQWETVGLAELESLFARILGPDQAPAWSETTVPADFILMLFDAWVEHSGARAGESPASTSSSKNTGTSSRPTSAASTRSGSRKRSTAKKAAPKVVSLPESS